MSRESDKQGHDTTSSPATEPEMIETSVIEPSPPKLSTSAAEPSIVRTMVVLSDEGNVLLRHAPSDARLKEADTTET